MFLSMFLMATALQRPYDVSVEADVSCKIFNTRSPDQYQFVKIEEIATGQIVFQSAVKGGQSREVFVKTNKIKVEQKWAGDRAYHSGAIHTCAKGNTIRI